MAKKEKKRGASSWRPSRAVAVRACVREGSNKLARLDSFYGGVMRAEAKRGEAQGARAQLQETTGLLLQQRACVPTRHANRPTDQKAIQWGKANTLQNRTGLREQLTLPCNDHRQTDTLTVATIVLHKEYNVVCAGW